MDELTPKYRIEYFLDAIINNTTPPEPLYRIEYYLAKIAGATVEIPTPLYRAEFYLAKLCGENVEIPDPLYRMEFWLAAKCGMNVTTPEPLYRMEFWLDEWVNGFQTFTGSIARFLSPSSKPVKSIVCNIDPVQDLHGYDNPWPAGGGKNKLPPRTIAELQALNTSGTWSGNTYTHNGVSFACSVEDGYVNTLTLSGTATAFARFDFYRREDFAQFSGMIMNWYTQYISGIGITIQGSYSPWTTYVASPGTDRTIDTIDNSTCNLFASVQANTVISSPLPMKPMIRLSSVSDATFSPYSNICPISGFTGLNVYGTGKNLLPNLTGLRTVESIFIGQTNGSTYPFHLQSGVTYCISFVADGTSPTAYFKENGGANQLWGASGSAYTPSKDMDVQLWVYAEGLTSVTDAQIEIGSTASAYSPYVGTTPPVSWQSEAGTVYAGYLSIDKDGNVTLTATHELVDLGTQNWDYNSTYKFFTTNVVGKKNGTENIQCSSYSYGNIWAASSDFVMAGNGSNNTVYIKDSRYTDPSVFQTAMSGVQLVYELATPVTYTLTSVTVPSTVQGENNWWHDANGNITIEAIGTPISSDEPDALQSLNILLGGAYTPRANFSEPTDEQALNIIMGGSR